MINIKELLEGLEYTVKKRRTSYYNKFPYNCGYVFPGGGQTYDCIGLVKSPINNKNVFYLDTPGQYARPGVGIPDGYGEIDILNAGSGITWNNFSNIPNGSYLYMAGHGAWYVGNLFGKDSNVNVVECTITDYWPADGVVASYIDPATGGRYDCKGGKLLGRWQAHSLLSSYVNDELWYQCGGDWFYGHVPRWIKDHNYNSKWFHVGELGKMTTGWLYDQNYKCWFYLCPKNDGNHYTGEMWTGWLQDIGAWYYLCPKNDGEHYTGEMITGDYQIGGKTYHFDKTGELV